MAKRTNPATVGVFVLGGIALVVALILVVGSSKLFSPQHEFVCFFPGDLNGLKVGAAVKFRGVQIGSVSGIRINLPGRVTAGSVIAAHSHKLRLPVIIQLDEKQAVGLGAKGDVDVVQKMRELIGDGLRAQLATESLPTGLLYVNLDFYPDTPAKLVLAPDDKDYREIPTLATQFAQLQEAAMRGLGKLDQIDFQALVSALTGAARSAHDFVASPDLKAAVASLGDAAQSLRQTSDTTRESLGNLNREFKPLATSLRNTSDRAGVTIQQTNDLVTALERSTDPDSPLFYQLTRAANNLGEASQAMRDLAVDLERNPSSLVRGQAVSTSP
jgi:paraquat-inducible protein B